MSRRDRKPTLPTRSPADDKYINAIGSTGHNVCEGARQDYKQVCLPVTPERIDELLASAARAHGPDLRRLAQVLLPLRSAATECINRRLAFARRCIRPEAHDRGHDKQIRMMIDVAKRLEEAWQALPARERLHAARPPPSGRAPAPPVPRAGFAALADSDSD